MRPLSLRSERSIIVARKTEYGGQQAMPMYVYKCDDCGNHFEQLQKFSDKPLKTCPRCKGHVKRVIHPTGIVFKGSGWYINDSRKGGSDSSSESKPESKTSSSSE
jgi:putative FmdB family regulatory protein